MLVSGLAELSPGPSLGAALAAIELSEVAGEELVTVLCADYRQRCHQEARYLAAVVETAVAQPGFARLPEVSEWAASEIAAALTLTAATSARELDFARMVVLHLPSVHAAMHAGLLDRGKAWVFADILADLSEEQRAAICAVTVGPAEGLTSAQLRARLRRLAIEIDPEWAARRYQAALGERRVVAYLAQDGTVTLTCTGLAPCEAAAADRRLARLAGRIRRAGHPATKAQIRADLCLRLLDGSLQPCTEQQIVELFLGRTHTPDSSATPARSAPDPDGAELAAEASPPPSAPRPSTPLPGTREGIELRAGLAMLLCLDERPGEVPGLGPVLAEEARAQVMRQKRGGEWRYAITDETGRLVLGGMTRRRPKLPGGTSRGGIVELHISVALLARLTADPVASGPWAAVIADIAAQYADRERALERLNADPGARLAGAGLERYVQIRDRYCVGVGCRRSAADCDTDHTRDYALGGRTVDANTGSLCLRCHGYKTRGWWRLRQSRPGRFLWVSKLGRRYRTRGELIDPPTVAPVPRARRVQGEGPAPARPPPDPPVVPTPRRRVGGRDQSSRASSSDR